MNTYDDKWWKEGQKDEADMLTQEAELAIAELESTLADALKVNNQVDWNGLGRNTPYPHPKPIVPTIEVPKEPDRSDTKYVPHISFVDRLFFKSRIDRKEQACSDRFATDYKNWRDRAAEKREYERSLAMWEESKEEYECKLNAQKNRIVKLHEEYFQKHPDAVLEYCGMVLRRSKYPDYGSKQATIGHGREPGILVVDMELPNIDRIPSTKSAKFVASRYEIVEAKLPDAKLRKLYESFLYQIALRTIYELFDADDADALRSVVFNGFVASYDKATGSKVRPCIMSVRAEKEEFMGMDLSKVDPKECFKHIKGVASVVY